MKHIKKFNENFIKRGFNKVIGKPLSIGNRITDSEYSSNEGLPYLKTSYLKNFIKYLKGEMNNKPNKDNIKRYLNEIKSDLDKIIKDKASKSHWSEYKDKYKKIEDINSKIFWSMNKITDYDPNNKPQYDNLINIAKELYDMSYNEGN